MRNRGESRAHFAFKELTELSIYSINDLLTQTSMDKVVSGEYLTRMSDEVARDWLTKFC